MQSTFYIPTVAAGNGWSPGVSLAQPQQHVVQAQQVIQPHNYQAHCGQTGYAIQPAKSAPMTVPTQSAQMTMSCGVWQSAQQQAEWSWQQESAKLRQQFQFLQSEYQNAIYQLRELNIKHSGIEKELEVEQWKYSELSKKFVEDVQNEQRKYEVLNTLHTETIKLLQNEKHKYNLLSAELENNRTILEKEQRKNEVLKVLNSEVVKVLESEALQREKQKEAETNVSPKSGVQSQEFVGNVASTQRPKCNEDSAAKSISKANAGSEDLHVPPGFESCSPASKDAQGRENFIEL